MAHKIYVGSEKVFDADDYEVAGAVASHAAAADPHPGYLTPAEGDAAYDAIGSAAAAQSAAEAASDPAGTAAGLVGTLASLLTTAKTNIVAAINEVVGWIGSLASLTTTAKSTIVASINEVHGEVVTARGASANLDTRLDGIDTQLAQNAKLIAKNDFVGGTATDGCWSSGTSASGTVTDQAADAIHVGCLRYVSSTSANSGGRWNTNIYAFVLWSSYVFYKSTIIFKTATDLTDVVRRIGFLSGVAITSPDHGCYCEMSGTTLSGKVAKAASTTTTSTTYTVATNTWYRLVIETLAVNSTKFTLYADNSDTVLWTETLTATLPDYTIGHGDVCLHTGTTAKTIGIIDYMDIYVSYMRKVV